jgi:multisubunit Na+/H+ antiporter MnhE subunit
VDAPSRSRRGLRRALAFAVAWLLTGALYLLLIDTTSVPELWVGAAVATLAAIGVELARESHVAGEGFSLRWLRHLHRPIASVPRDVAVLIGAAVRQCVAPQAKVGELRAVPFSTAAGDTPTRAFGRRATAEVMGSLSPNTFVIGIDPDRGLLYAHQLRPTEGRRDLDPLELG